MRAAGSRGRLCAALQAEAEIERPYRDPLVLSIEARLRRAGKGKRLIIRERQGGVVAAQKGFELSDAETRRTLADL